MMKRQRSKINSESVVTQRGIALLMVMWIIILLFVIAAEFTFTMRTELDITRNMRDDMACYFLALAGIQAAYHELLNNVDNVYRDEQGTLILEDASKSDLVSQDKQTGEQVVEHLKIPPPIRTNVACGNGFFSYTVNDEDGKININRLLHADPKPDSPYQALRRLFIDSGVETGLEIDIIMDSILDWRDTNQEHRLNGAENEWYAANHGEQGFDYPYKSKDGAFDTIEELLMVRSISKEILYGTNKAIEMFGREAIESRREEDRIYTGIYQYITVFNVGMKLNENTAADALIQAMYPEQSEEILDSRKSKDGRYQERQLSSYFTITSTGYLPTSDVVRTVQVTVWRRGRQQSTSLEVQFWKDDIYEETAAVIREQNEAGED